MTKPKAEPAGRALVPLIPAGDEVRAQAFRDGPRLQARKVTEEKFDAARKKLFLETLRRTANVTPSAKAAGIVPNGAADQLWKNVSSGAILPFRAQYIRATGTTAADILALY
jgi:hypothetical protein